MSKVKLYGLDSSQPYRSVLWVCLFKNVPIQRETIIPGRTEPRGGRSPEYLKISPSGSVPAIEDNGFTLFESAAILIYLSEKYGWSDLYPNDIHLRAKVNQYLHWHHRNTREITIKLVAPYVRPEFKLPFGPSEEIKAKAVVANLDRMFFSQSKFIVGDQLTIADFICFEELVQCEKEFFGVFDFSDFPNVVRWLNDMKKIPKYEEAHGGLTKFVSYFKQAKDKVTNAKL